MKLRYHYHKIKALARHIHIFNTYLIYSIDFTIWTVKLLFLGRITIIYGKYFKIHTVRNLNKIVTKNVIIYESKVKVYRNIPVPEYMISLCNTDENYNQ